MKKWMWISAVAVGLAVPAVWASCGNCSHDKEAKAEKTAASSGEKHKECSKSAKAAADKECPKEHADQMFSKLDANSDGKIDRTEFTNGMSSMHKTWKADKHGKEARASGEPDVKLASASDKGEKSGCDKPCAKTAAARDCASKCPQKTASAVLSAFDLDGDGNLSAAEIERAQTILAAVVQVSKAEHTKLVSMTSSGGSACSKAKASGASIETLASQSFESLKQQGAAGTSSDASSTGDSQAQGG